MTLAAFRNVIRQHRRSAPPVLAVAAGIAALVLATGFIEWNLWFGRESTIHSQLGHVRVFKEGYRGKGTAEPFKYLLADEATVRTLEAQPHVVAVAPRLSFNGLISQGDSTISFIGEGVAPDKEASLARSLTIVEGGPLSVREPQGIVLGQGLAANLGVKPGDAVVLVVNTESGGINGVEARVLGFFRTITKAYDDTALRVPITLARELLRVSGAHSHALVLDKTESTDSVVRALRHQFAREPLEFVPWYDLADFYNKTAALFSRQVTVLHVIVAIIILLGISNSMMMNVLERTNEIGTAMALGTRRSRILGLFLSEGMLLGVFGGLLGLAGGYFAAKGISAIGIPMPPPPGMSFGYSAGIMVSWLAALQAFVLAVLTTLAASVYPAWRASRLTIVDALRHNR
jgi:putative ABC transport system permease protein